MNNTCADYTISIINVWFIGLNRNSKFLREKTEVEHEITYSELSNSDEIDAEVLSRLQIRKQSLQIRPRDAAKNSGIIYNV